MVAAGIAYLLTAIFVLLGLAGLVVAWRGRPKDRGSSITLSVFFLAAAWLCAHLGGI
jgi:hypothetical protein